jgi:hypothetical protein
MFSLCCPRARNALLGKFVLHLVFHLSFSSKECQLIREGFLVLNRYYFDIFFMGVRTVDCYYGPAVPPYYSSAGSDPSNLSLFGPAAPPYYSSAGSDPSNLSLQASNTFELFECGLWSLESSSLGQQRLRIIRVRASVPQVIFFGPAAPQHYSSLGF